MSTKARNGAAADEATAKRVKFVTTDDPAPKPAVELPRDHPRDGESFADWITATAKSLAVVRHDASLTTRRKDRIATELLERARTDEEFGGSRIARALLEAAEIWDKMNPEIEGDLGHVRDSSRDLLGRSVRGPARAVAMVLESLTEAPERATALSPAEEELLRSLAPKVTTAINALRQTTAERLEAVLAAVNASQVTYPPGEPGPAIVREPEGATTP